MKILKQNFSKRKFPQKSNKKLNKIFWNFFKKENTSGKRTDGTHCCFLLA
jgi:hypothetical protein